MDLQRILYRLWLVFCNCACDDRCVQRSRSFCAPVLENTRVQISGAVGEKDRRKSYKEVAEAWQSLICVDFSLREECL